MPRPATVTTLLRIVEEQSAVIRALTEALRDNIAPSVTGLGSKGVTQSPFVPLPPPEQKPYVLSEYVMAAIEKAPAADAAAREYLEFWAAEALDNGMEEAMVVQMIAQGEQ